MRGWGVPAGRDVRLAGIVVLMRLVPLLLAGTVLGGCSAMTGSLFPSFGFSDTSSSPDCGEIEQRMQSARTTYASVLGKEKPAVYLGFAGNLSRAMKAKHLKGVHELTDLQLDEVVTETRDQCLSQQLPRTVCNGADRLADAYRPMIVAAHDAYNNYCGDRPIR
jgi:hypothetical protein